jgi:hypothetical protein
MAHDAERWLRVIRLLDQTYTRYERGLAVLRRRVVDDMRRKVKESGVLDYSREGSTPRAAAARKQR